jgi:hypothetical protein
MDAAVKHCTESIGIWQWGGQQRPERRAGCGDGLRW